MSKMHHPNIMQFKDFSIDKERKKVYMVTEYITGKNLEECLKKKKTFKEWEARYIFTEILKGIQYIH